MKLIKTIGKIALAVTAIMYAVCIVNGITVIEYSATSEGGTLSIVGRTVEINGKLASAFFDTYAKAETEAAKWLPEKIKKTVEQISDLLNGKRD